MRRSLLGVGGQKATPRGGSSSHEKPCRHYGHAHNPCPARTKTLCGPCVPRDSRGSSRHNFIASFSTAAWLQSDPPPPNADSLARLPIRLPANLRGRLRSAGGRLHSRTWCSSRDLHDTRLREGMRALTVRAPTCTRLLWCSVTTVPCAAGHAVRKHSERPRSPVRRDNAVRKHSESPTGAMCARPSAPQLHHAAPGGKRAGALDSACTNGSGRMLVSVYLSVSQQHQCARCLFARACVETANSEASLKAHRVRWRLRLR
jgi:hypothetical protein